MISHWLLLLWYYGIKYLYPRYVDQNLPHFNLASKLALFHQCWMIHCDTLASISDDHDDVIGPGGSRLLPSYLWFIVVNHSLFYGLCGANIYTSRWLVRMRFVLFARRLYSKKEALFLYIESDGFELHNIWNKKQNKTKDKKSKGYGNIGLNINAIYRECRELSRTCRNWRSTKLSYKIAQVIQIFKSNQHDSFTNYRPIFLCSNWSYNFLVTKFWILANTVSGMVTRKSTQLPSNT